ncbi:MAG: hypothetical protein ACPGSL_03795 [Vicingaceae bacterium]
MSKKEETTTAVNNDPKIDAIKQLIFGENMTEYDQRFDETLKSLEEAKAEIEEKRKEMDTKIQDTLNAMNTEFEKKMNAMETLFLNHVERLDNKKTDRKALGKMLQNISEKLQA